MKQIIYTFFAIFFSINSSVFADDEILLICTSTQSVKHHFLINKTKSIAKVMDVSISPIVGKFTETENAYILLFPKISTKNVNRYETHVVINRYSGKMEYEIGTPPFREYNVTNRLIWGDCSIRKNVKKF